MSESIMEQDVANLRRANRVKRTLVHYQKVEKGQHGTIDKDTLTALLTDIRHYCDREGYSYWDLEKTAQHHYTAEVVNPQGRA